MRISEVSKGMSVEDKWYPENGVGTIVSVKDTEVRVKFPNCIKKYDVINLVNLRRK